MAVLSALSLALAGCGDSTPLITPEPQPSASSPSTAAPTSRDFLHVLWGQTVTAYRIDPAAGTLEPVATQEIGDAHTITGEPRGRYLYAGYGPRWAEPDYSGPKPTIVAYRPGPDGRLTAVSEATSDPSARSTYGVRGEWLRLRAGTDRVHGVWMTGTYHDDYNTYVTHAVAAEGQLGTAQQRLFTEDYQEIPAVDPGGDSVFRGRNSELVAYAVEPDDVLRSTGISSLCAGTSVRVTAPLAAVGGQVFALATPAGRDTGRTVCSWKAPRLAPRENLGFDAHLAAAYAPQPAIGNSSDVPGARTRPMVVFEEGVPAIHHSSGRLRLFEIGSEGESQPRHDLEVAGVADAMLFHPSGRFLYRLVDDAVTVYAIGDDGRLSLVQTVPGSGRAGADRLAITRVTTGS